MPRAKKSYNRPGYKSCGKMVYGDAKKALALAKSVKRMINVEYNIRDTVITGSGVNVTPEIVQLSNMGQGDSNILRDGNQVKFTNIQLKYFVSMSQAATASCVRVLLIQDKQTNTSIYTAGEILKNVTAGDGINSPYNENFRRRFKILFDRVHDLSITGNQIGRGVKYIRLSVPVRYNGTGSTIAALTENSFSLMFLSSEPTNEPQITAFVRLLFVDN